MKGLTAIMKIKNTKRNRTAVEVNKDFAFDILFKDPETDEILRPETIGIENEKLVIYIRDKSGKRKWKHTIVTEEI